MQSITLEHVKAAGDVRENNDAYKTLKPLVGKKVVLVFKKPQRTNRGDITRHHCTIESLWARGITFSPALRFPREKMPAALFNGVWFAEIKNVEVVS